MRNLMRQWVGLILIIGGFLVSADLLFRTFALMEERGGDVINVCSALFGLACDAALLSPTSWQLGIPLAGWGVIYYGTLGILIPLAMLMRSAVLPETIITARALSFIGMLVSVVLLLSILAGWAPLCPLCIVVHGLNFALLPFLWFPWRLETAVDLFEKTRQLKGPVADRPKSKPLENWRLLPVVCIGLFSLVLYQWVLIQTERHTVGLPAPEKVKAEFLSTEKQTITPSPGDPRLGGSNEPVQLVVFSSFQCPGCRTFAKSMYDLAERFGDRLEIVFKHYPLSTSCNPIAKVNLHPRACQLALAAEAANMQGKFWTFHDGLFETDLSGSDELLLKVARDSDLDIEQFKTDRAGDPVRLKVEADVELGNRLGLHATPSVFLNSRHLGYRSNWALEMLIEYELRTTTVTPTP